MSQATITKPAFVGVGAIAKATGVSTVTVHRWELRGVLPAALRTDTGHRIWPSDVFDEILAARAAAARRGVPAG